MSTAGSALPKGKITFDEEKCMWAIMPLLKREMDAGVMLKELTRQKVLNYKDQQRIRSKPTNSAKNETLIEIMMNRTSAGFRAFAKALNVTGHTMAYNALLDTLSKEMKTTLLEEASGRGPLHSTGSVFVEAERVSPPTKDDDQEEEMMSRRRSILAPPPPAVKKSVTISEPMLERHAAMIVQLRKDLETAKHESIGLREENFRIVDDNKLKQRRIDQLSLMVEAGRTKIAKLLAENRKPNRELEELRREFEKAKKEIASLKEKLERLENTRGDGSTAATHPPHDADGALGEQVVRQLERMKGDIILEMKQDRSPGVQSVLHSSPSLSASPRRLSFQPAPALSGGGGGGGGNGSGSGGGGAFSFGRRPSDVIGGQVVNQLEKMKTEILQEMKQDRKSAAAGGRGGGGKDGAASLPDPAGVGIGAVKPLIYTLPPPLMPPMDSSNRISLPLKFTDDPVIKALTARTSKSKKTPRIKTSTGAGWDKSWLPHGDVPLWFNGMGPRAAKHAKRRPDHPRTTRDRHDDLVWARVSDGLLRQQRQSDDHWHKLEWSPDKKTLRGFLTDRGDRRKLTHRSLVLKEV